MNSPSEPRFNKLPFILTDAACLIAAFLIGYLSKEPFAPVPLISIAVLVIMGGVALLIPYITDYIADSSEANARLRDELELQIKRAQAAGESLTRAAAQIKAIEEAVHKSARDAETLPYRMQEKLAEFNEALAAKENDDREALEQELEELRAANSTQLKAVADKIAKAATDWAALEVATRQQLTGAETVVAKLQTGTAHAAEKFDARISSALKHLDAKVVELEKALQAAPTPAAAPAKQEKPVSHEAPAAPVPIPAAIILEPQPAEPAAPTPVVEPAAVTPEPAPAAVETAPAPAGEPAAPSVEEEAPKPKKPRAPRKPKADEILDAMSTEPVVTAPSEAAPAEPAPEPMPAVAASSEESSSPDSDGENAVEASASSDGATRLLATAYIGIGNKLFIRGDGPGLSWDHGVPMQFVSIGKWGWFTHEASGPVRIKLYKNDELAALSGEITLEPGRHSEVTALF